VEWPTFWDTYSCGEAIKLKALSKWFMALSKAFMYLHHPISRPFQYPLKELPERTPLLDGAVYLLSFLDTSKCVKGERSLT
jgi:hypothetical protein